MKMTWTNCNKTKQLFKQHTLPGLSSNFTSKLVTNWVPTTIPTQTHSQQGHLRTQNSNFIIQIVTNKFCDFSRRKCSASMESNLHFDKLTWRCFATAILCVSGAFWTSLLQRFMQHYKLLDRSNNVWIRPDPIFTFPIKCFYYSALRQDVAGVNFTVTPFNYVAPRRAVGNCWNCHSFFWSLASCEINST